MKVDRNYLWNYVNIWISGYEAEIAGYCGIVAANLVTEIKNNIRDKHRLVCIRPKVLF